MYHKKRTRHSSAMLDCGGLLRAYTSRKRSGVEDLTMAGRHVDGTWMVPTSSLLSSRQVPTKSKERQCSANETPWGGA